MPTSEIKGPPDVEMPELLKRSLAQLTEELVEKLKKGISPRDLENRARDFYRIRDQVPEAALDDDEKATLEDWAVQLSSLGYSRDDLARVEEIGRGIPRGMGGEVLSRREAVGQLKEMVRKGGIEPGAVNAVIQDLDRLVALDPDLADPDVWARIEEMKRRVLAGEALEIDREEIKRVRDERARYFALLAEKGAEGRFSYREMALREIETLVHELGGDEERAWREWTIARLKELSASAASSRDAGNYEIMGKLAGAMGLLPERYAYLREIYIAWRDWHDFLEGHKGSGSAEDANRLSYIVDGQKLAEIMEYKETMAVKVRTRAGREVTRRVDVDIADFLDEYDREEWSSIKNAEAGEKWGKMVTKDETALVQRRRELRREVIKKKLGLKRGDRVVGINGRKAGLDDLLEATGWAENFALGFYDAWRISYWDVLFNGRTKDWLGKIDRFPRYCHMYGISAGNLRDRADLGMRNFYEYASGDLLFKPFIETFVAGLPRKLQVEARNVIKSKLYTQKEVRGWMRSWGQIAKQEWTKEEEKAIASGSWKKQLEEIGVNTRGLLDRDMKGVSGFKLFFNNISYRSLHYRDLIPDKVGKCYGYLKDANGTRVMLLSGAKGAMLVPGRSNIQELIGGYSWCDNVERARIFTRFISGVVQLRTRKWLGSLEIVVEEPPQRTSKLKEKAGSGEVKADNAGVVLDRDGDIVYEKVPLNLWSNTARDMSMNAGQILKAVNIPSQQTIGVRDYEWLTLGLRKKDLGWYGRRYYWSLMSETAFDMLFENLTRMGVYDRRTAEALKDTLRGVPLKRWARERIADISWVEVFTDMLAGAAGLKRL